MSTFQIERMDFVCIAALTLILIGFGIQGWESNERSRDTDSWISAAKIAPSAGEIDRYLSKALEGMRKHNLLSGNGAILGNDPGKDYNLIYRIISSLRDDARRIAQGSGGDLNDVRQTLNELDTNFGVWSFFDFSLASKLGTLIIVSASLFVAGAAFFSSHVEEVEEVST